MEKREIACLACKILSIYIIIQGINVLGSVFYIPFVVPGQETLWDWKSMVFTFVFLIFLGIILWIFSDKLSGLMVKRENYNDKDIKGSELQRIAFSVLGLYFVGNSLPQLISLMANHYLMHEVPYATTRLVLGGLDSIAEFVIGFGIFFGSQGLVNLLKFLRNAGVKREFDTEVNDGRLE